MPEEADDAAAEDRSQEAPLVAEASPELPRPPSPDELLLQPAIRDCSLRSYSVRNGLRTTALRVRVNHLRVLTAASARLLKKAREPAPRDTERKSPTTNSVAA